MIQHLCQRWRTQGTRARNGTPKNFLGTPKKIFALKIFKYILLARKIMIYFENGHASPKRFAIAVLHNSRRRKNVAYVMNHQVKVQQHYFGFKFNRSFNIKCFIIKPKKKGTDRIGCLLVVLF